MEWIHQFTWKTPTRFAVVILYAFMVTACGKNESPTPPTPPMLGMSFDQVEALCGPGKILGVQAQGKLVSYDHLADVSARVGYHDNTVAKVWYNIGADSIEDKKLQHYLLLNAQGHQWTMLDATTQGTWLSAHWIRDDGATASCGGEDGPFLGVAVLGFVKNDSSATTEPPSGSSFRLRVDKAEYVKKLGEPFKRETDFMRPASETLMFNHKTSDCELMLNVSFWHGGAHLVIASRREQKDLNETDIRNVLQMFSEDERWDSVAPDQSEGERRWNRRENVMAVLRQMGHCNAICISTDEFNQARMQMSEPK